MTKEQEDRIRSLGIAAERARIAYEADLVRNVPQDDEEERVKMAGESAVIFARYHETLDELNRYISKTK
jgi:hypothetical protein